MQPDARAAPSHAWSCPTCSPTAAILAVPALVLFFYIESPAGRWLSFAVFVAASVTDFFDGYLARAWHQQSAIGRILDPIADKCWSRPLLLLASGRTIGGWSLLAAIVILTREISVSNCYCSLLIPSYLPNPKPQTPNPQNPKPR